MDPSSSLDLRQQAINAAMDSLWEKAIRLNRQILKTDPENVDTLNRLARAYFETEDFAKAKKYYNQALGIDPYNPIAQKNLKILKASNLKPNGINSNGYIKIKLSPYIFLEEPGKTKIVSLLKVAEPQILCKVFCGMPVDLNLKARGITIISNPYGYIGVLPDDLAFQIIRLIKGGNKYEAFVKSVKVNGLSILIREIYRSSRFKNQPSFLDSNSNYSTGFWDEVRTPDKSTFKEES
ncbi:MAG: hypothetical protein G01um101493_371 [Microgenomates group bacterium Gr01-1014_93]|nr:MAG: hypothetical protein G01um101493_371 [Microgenomates group bacterium Gr01-1014_93]